MHITRLRIVNFQRHECFEQELTPGINAIVGPGDRGKSAIIRAIKWCLTNKPDGTGFVRNWYDEDGVQHTAKQAEVKVWLSNGAAIERIRGKAVNRYVVTKPDGESIELNRFGRGVVPPEVSEWTGIEPVVIGDEDVVVQIQEQHDSSFLLAGISAPARWKALSVLAGTEVADRATASIEADIRELGKGINKIAEDVEERQSRLALVDQTLSERRTFRDELQQDLAKASAARKRADTIQDLADRHQSNRQSLETTTARSDLLQTFLLRCKDWLDRLEHGTELAKKLRDADRALVENERRRLGLSTRIVKLQPIAVLSLPDEQIQAAVQLQTALNASRAWRSAADKVEGRLGVVEAVLQALEVPPIVEQYQALLIHVSEAQRWRAEQENVQSRLSQSQERIDKLQAQLDEVLREALVCPTCGQKTSEIHSSCS